MAAYYEVVVGNIGIVYGGGDETIARNLYADYVKISKSGVGRAGGEIVTLLKDGEIELEHELEDPAHWTKYAIEETTPFPPEDESTPQQVADEDFRQNNPHDGDTE